MFSEIGRKKFGGLRKHLEICTQNTQTVMILNKKDFVAWCCASTPYNKTMVLHIIELYQQWIQSSLLSGHDVRMDFGKFTVKENKYSDRGMYKNKPDYHMHAYRPGFSYLQRFKEDMDKAEETIAQGKGRVEIIRSYES